MQKRSQKLIYPKARWEVDAHTPCPCGSGLQYLQCCRDNREFREKGYEYFRTKDYANAERAWRAKLTEYVGFVITQTLVMLARAGAAPAGLVRIDIGALAEIAENLAWALEKQGKMEAILHTFDHLVRTVPLPGLLERLAYLKCLWLRHKLNKPEEAATIIARWPSYEDIKDICLLQMYFEIHASGLSHTKYLDVVARIIDRTESLTEKLHYSNARAMCLVMMGDEDEARQFHRDAMGNFLGAAIAEAEKGKSYACEVCARALEFQWYYEKDDVAFQRALSFYDRIDIGSLVPEGASAILHEKGRLLLRKGEIDESVKCFTDALNRHSGVLPRIYRIEAYSRAKRLEEARQDYEVLSVGQIPEAYLLEFYSCAALLAAQAADVGLAKSLLARTKNLTLRVMCFRYQRDQLCIELLEFIDRKRSQPKKPTALGRIVRILEKIRGFSEYLELKPNIAGVGVNLNKVLEPKGKDSVPEKRG